MTNTIVYCRPYVFLRCVKCKRNTPHVMINIYDNLRAYEIMEDYECQECSETKTIYEPIQ